MLKWHLLYFFLPSIVVQNQNTSVFNDQCKSQTLQATLSFNFRGWLISICAVRECLWSPLKWTIMCHLTRKLLQFEAYVDWFKYADCHKNNFILFSIVWASPFNVILRLTWRKTSRTWKPWLLCYVFPLIFFKSRLLFVFQIFWGKISFKNHYVS